MSKLHIRATLSTLVAVTLLVTGAALAADNLPLVLYKKDIAINTTYAWERWGNFINAIPGDGKEIPYDAAKLRARVYAFPSGEIRVINFDVGVRTHNHVNMTDTILYTWTGRRVQFVNDQAAINRPGDAAFHPKGVFHHGEALETGKGIEFAMYVDTRQSDPQATWIPASTRPKEPAAVWSESGAIREAVGAAAASAPANATHFDVRTFDFSPHYVARELWVPRGARITMNGTKDRLMFLLAGQVTLSADGKTWQMAVEDAARAPAGQLVTLTALEDSRILEAYVSARPAAK